MYDKYWKNINQNENSVCMEGKFENMNSLCVCVCVCVLLFAMLLEFSRYGLYNQKKNVI